MNTNQLEWLDSPADFWEGTELTADKVISDEAEMPTSSSTQTQCLAVLVKRQTGGIQMFGYLGMVHEPNDSGRLLVEVSVPPKGRDFSDDAHYVLDVLMQAVRFHHDAFAPLGSGILSVTHARVHPVDTRYSSWQLCTQVLIAGLDERNLGEANYAIVSNSRDLPTNLPHIADLARSAHPRAVRLAELCVENYCHYWGINGEKLSFGLSSTVKQSSGQEPGLADNKLFFKTTAPGLTATKIQPAVLQHLRQGSINEQYQALLWLVRHGDADAIQGAQAWLLGESTEMKN